MRLHVCVVADGIKVYVHAIAAVKTLAYSARDQATRLP